MEAKLVEELPTGDGWQYEPKWDGFRCLVIRDGAHVELQGKSGKPLSRFFPDVVELVRARKPCRFVVDGELLIPTDGSYSFEALQLRLHPAASRVRKLAAESPAVFIAFDILMDARGRSLAEKPLAERRAALEALGVEDARIRLSRFTRDRAVAARWLSKTGGAIDGVVAKRVDGMYAFGERAMLKVKRLRTADCVVGGFRYAEGTKDAGSLLLGLYDARGLLDHVGFTSTIAHKDRPALTKKLEKLRRPPGFTGRAPGGPSRWSTSRSEKWEPVAPVLVVEVRYDHVTDNRFRHGTKFIRWRPDKAPKQCTFAQLGF